MKVLLVRWLINSTALLVVAHLVSGVSLARFRSIAQTVLAYDLRVTPALVFEYDTTPDTARRVDDLLRSVAPHGEEDDEE